MTTDTPLRPLILWAELPAFYLADLLEDEHPTLAHHLRTKEWVPMSLEDARAAEAATATPTTPDTEEREAAWICAMLAVRDIEREHKRQTTMQAMRERGLWRWLSDRSSEEGTTQQYIAETEAVPCLWPNGRYPKSQEDILEAVRREGKDQGITWLA